ncbi:MAG: PIN domain-containing protein [Candidatus Eremiobacteraeota bacterium]|nr:PIN domain-containing protein [Candidatus Eremiobacteraeota bacterium]
MILCDTNVWLALTLSAHQNHPQAVQWLESIQQLQSVWFCRPTQSSLLRLLTSGAVLAPYGIPALSNGAALDLFDRLLQDDRIGLVAAEPPGLEAWWHQYAGVPTASPKLWMDAYLAAFAVSGGYQLVTFDKAFHQFSGLDLKLLK